MSLSREEAAQKLGMKPSEILKVERDGGVHVVTTHDGVKTEIDGDKLTTRQGDGDVVVAEATEDGPEVVSSGSPDGQASVVAEAMALPPKGADRAEVRVVDETLFGAATVEDLAELGLARLGGSPVAAPAHPILDGDATDDHDLAKALAGTKADVARWVGNDPDKARRAIDAEKARTDQPPRVTLIADLEKLIKDAERG